MAKLKKLYPSGDSIVLSVSPEALRALGVESGDTVEVHRLEDKLEIRKAPELYQDE